MLSHVRFDLLALVCQLGQLALYRCGLLGQVTFGDALRLGLGRIGVVGRVTRPGFRAGLAVLTRVCAGLQAAGFDHVQVVLDPAGQVHHLASHQGELLVGHPFKQITVVRDHNQGSGPGVQQVLHHGKHVGIQVVAGLIHDKNVGLVQEYQEELHASLLAARKVLYPGHQLGALEAQPLHELPGGHLLAFDHVGGLVTAQDLLDSVLAELLQLIQTLGQDRELDGLPDVDVTGRGVGPSVYQPQEGGLARPIGADYAEPVPGADQPGHVVQHHVAAYGPGLGRSSSVRRGIVGVLGNRDRAHQRLLGEGGGDGVDSALRCHALVRPVAALMSRRTVRVYLGHIDKVDHLLAQAGCGHPFQLQGVAHGGHVGYQLAGSLDVELLLGGSGPGSTGQPCQLLAGQVATFGFRQIGLALALHPLQHVCAVPALEGVDDTVMHLPHRGADLVQEPPVVGDQEQGAGVLGPPVLQVLGQPVDGDHVEVIGRLVQGQDVPVLEQEPGQVRPAALAAREGAHLGLQLHAAQKGLDDFTRPGVGGPFVVLAVLQGGLADRVLVLQGVPLIQHAKGQAIAHGHPPLVGFLGTVQEVKERGLSVPVPPHDADSVTLEDALGYIRKDGFGCKGQGYVFQTEIIDGHDSPIYRQPWMGGAAAESCEAAVGRGISGR